MNEQNLSNHIEMTTEIVAAYVSHNSVPAGDLSNIIASVHKALQNLNVDSSATDSPKAEEIKPAVPIKKSVSPDFIICLEDGKKFKSLKRHLMTAYSMTPEQYRAKWSLPKDYPMVAPNYSAARSQLAKALGLGQVRRKQPRAAKPQATKKAA